MAKLTAKKVASLNEPGFYGDGEGLHLKVSKGGGKLWILRAMVHSRRRDFGLGSASLVPLAEAREISRSYRKIARQGGDPLAARRMPEMRFREAAETVYELNRPSWRNANHAQGWISSIEQYADPVLGDRVIDTIGTADVLTVLSPIWATKNETARRVKQRLSKIFDWAKGNGFYSKENSVNGGPNRFPK